MNKETALFVVRTIWLSSFLRLCRAFISSLMMLENVGLHLAVNSVSTSLTLAQCLIQLDFPNRLFSAIESQMYLLAVM